MTCITLFFFGGLRYDDLQSWVKVVSNNTLQPPIKKETRKKYTCYMFWNELYMIYIYTQCILKTSWVSKLVLLGDV